MATMWCAGQEMGTATASTYWSSTAVSEDSCIPYNTIEYHEYGSPTTYTIETWSTGSSATWPGPSNSYYYKRFDSNGVQPEWGEIQIEWQPSFRTPIPPEAFEPAPSNESMERARQALEERQTERQRQLLESQEQANRLREERVRVQEEIKARSVDLLESLLTQSELDEYRETGQITLKGPNGKRKWIIAPRGAYAITECNKKGEPYQEHCVVTPGVPIADQMAAHLLYLKTDPQALLRVANTRPL